MCTTRLTRSRLKVYTLSLSSFYKIDVDIIAREPNSVVISCEQDLNLDYLVSKVWENLGLIRVYTKKKGNAPDFDDAVILKV